MRVLITGMGGELGTRVAQLLEDDRRVDSITGIDLHPPRRRLRRADFHRVDPRSRRRMVELVRETGPTHIAHLAVYEPYARTPPRAAPQHSSATSIAVLGAAAECSGLERILVRSGVEIYGRRRGSATRPDELVPPDPTSPFGRSLLGIEGVAATAGRQADVPVTSLRFAPLVGPHFPSPLGRYLRLPVVAVSALADLPFSLLHQEDAAKAVVAALTRGPDGPVNVVAPGAVTAFQAARLGGRVPLPVAGPAWLLVRRVAELTGAPLADHVHELLVRGRTADGSAAARLLGVAPAHPTADVVKDLYEWASVTPLRPVQEAA